MDRNLHMSLIQPIFPPCLIRDEELGMARFQVPRQWRLSMKGIPAVYFHSFAVLPTIWMDIKRQSESHR